MASERIIRSIAGPGDDGARLDLWLAGRFPYLSRARWQEEIREERILLNGAKTRCSRVLRAGDTVAFQPSGEEPPVVFDYRIIHEDAELLVVDKGGGLPCHPAGAFFKNTLWYDLSQTYGQVSVINRLDRETSGLLIVARNSSAAAALSAQLQDGGMEKTYHALVYGEMNSPMVAEGYLSGDPSAAVRKKRVFSRKKGDGEAEYAFTEFIPVRQADGMTLVLAKPRTGRLHQIRATLCSLGYPMVGDKIYGPDETCYLRFLDDALTDEDRAVLRMPRQALHASGLVFNHPSSGAKMVFESPLPDDFIVI
jgi:23S rRNA pseudouridine955/2504/2580 synthase/23S rRNA pseudouridine1911/1915/1917 synthase